MNNQLPRANLTWFILGLALMLGIAFLPPQVELSVAGQRIIGILVFAVIMWISDAVPTNYSAVVIIFFLIVFLGFSPEQGGDGRLLGTAKAIPIALSGFTNSGTILVIAGLYMAAGIQLTGLEKRIAFNVLKIVGTRTNNIFAGIILILLILDFVIPSIIARAAIVTPLAIGLVEAFGVERNSVFARNLLVCVGMATSISGIGVLTAGIPNPIAVSFIEKYLYHSISWGEWFIYSMPYCLSMMMVLYLLLTRLNTFEFNEIPGGRLAIRKAIAELGPMTRDEKQISLIFGLTVLLWATENYHGVNVYTSAILAVMLMISPYIGISTWKELSNRANCSSILVFASAGISLGQALLNTGAAKWLAETTLGKLGLEHMAPAIIMAVIVTALIIIRFAFASITSAVATLIPTVLGLLLSFNNPQLPMWGMALVSTYTVYFSFILPITAPHCIVAYGTNTFDIKDFMKIGIPLSIIAIALLIIFWYTYWRWIGMVWN